MSSSSSFNSFRMLWFVFFHHHNELFVVTETGNHINVEGRHGLLTVFCGLQGLIELLYRVARFHYDCGHFLFEERLILFVNAGVFELIVVLIGLRVVSVELVCVLLGKLVEDSFTCIVIIAHPKDFQLTNNIVYNFLLFRGVYSINHF